MEVENGGAGGVAANVVAERVVASVVVIEGWGAREDEYVGALGERVSLGSGGCDCGECNWLLMDTAYESTLE